MEPQLNLGGTAGCYALLPSSKLVRSPNFNTMVHLVQFIMPVWADREIIMFFI